MSLLGGGLFSNSWGSIPKTYKLFISHMWKNEDNSDYYRLLDLLKSDNTFSWINYSVPAHDPLGMKTNQALSQALEQRISAIDCFVLISGMYVKYRKWIQHEIDLAMQYHKPIICVSPWGQERLPVELDRFARKVVGWNTQSVINAIKRYTL